MSVIRNPFVSFAYPGPRFKAAKVRFREGRNSRVVLDFNLYLAPGMIFTAMVTRNSADNPVLRTQSSACTAPAFVPSVEMPGWKEVTFSAANFVNYDKAGNDLGRAREGFFEVIEMGEPIATFPISGSLQFGEALTYADPIVPTGKQNCDAIVTGWAGNGVFRNSSNAEMGKPGGGLIGMGTIINVPQGTDYSFDPVALTDVFASARHRAPGDSEPTFTDAKPESLLISNGQAYLSHWTSGVDAVSAVLMHETVRNEYIASSPTLDASTDIVLTFPTASTYVSLSSQTGTSAAAAPFHFNFDDVNLLPPTYMQSRGACQPVIIDRYSTDGRRNGSSAGPLTPDGTDPADICWSTGILTLGDVFQSQNAADLTAHLATRSGGINIRFGNDKPLISNEGHKYFGLPVIGFAVEKYVNGNLNGVLSNYGGVLAHKYSTVVE